MGCNLDSNLRVSPSTAGSAAPLRPASNDPNTNTKGSKYSTGASENQRNIKNWKNGRPPDFFLQIVILDQFFCKLMY